MENRIDDKNLGKVLSDGPEMRENSDDGFPRICYRGFRPVLFDNDGREPGSHAKPYVAPLCGCGNLQYMR